MLAFAARVNVPGFAACQRYSRLPALAESKYDCHGKLGAQHPTSAFTWLFAPGFNVGAAVVSRLFLAADKVDQLQQTGEQVED